MEEEAGLDNLEKVDEEEDTDSEAGGTAGGKGKATLQHSVETGKGGQAPGVIKDAAKGQKAKRAAATKTCSNNNSTSSSGSGC